MSAFSDSSTIGQTQNTLAPRFKRPRDRAGHLVGAVERHGAGVDRLPPRRLVEQPRHVEIAIGGQHQGARDRGGAHQQRVGVVALGAEGEALLDPEAVLLVDHRQREIAKRDIRLHQRMRADDDRGQPGGEARQHRVARPPLLAPGQQADLDPGRRREALQHLVVLPRQHLGRRHQRRLAAALDRDQHRYAARRRSCRCRHRPATAASCGAAPSCRRRSPPGHGAGCRSAQSRTRPRPAPARRRCRRAPGRAAAAGGRAPAPPPAGWPGSRHRRGARAARCRGRDRRRFAAGERRRPPRASRANGGARAMQDRAIPAIPGARSSAAATPRATMRDDKPAVSG